jgi:hypothetical protein
MLETKSLLKETIRKTIFGFALTGLLLGAVFTSSGQTKLNFGLNQRQDPSTLPGSIVKPQTSVPKAKVAIQPSLQKVAENEYLLGSGWELADADQVTASGQSVFNPKLNTSGWYNATVPGTVLTTLVDQGIYPDPYFGLNNLFITDSLCRKDWWYRTIVKLPENSVEKTIWLLFNGINYKADVWLNGVLLGKIAGAFRRGEFDATRFMNLQGENILAVHIFPPYNPGIPQEESPSAGQGPNGGQLCLDGPTFISSEGWDWIPGIRDRNIGIWQDVRLRLTGAVTIVDPQVITDLPLPDTTSVFITLKSGIKNYSDKGQQVTLTGKIEKMEFSKTFDLKPNEFRIVTFSSKEFPQLNIKNPRLWWPNGYGHPELYLLDLQAKIKGQSLSDRKEVRFGVREFSYEMAVAQTANALWRVEFNPIKAAGMVLFNNTDRQDVGNGTFVSRLVASADPTLLTSIDKNSDNPFLTIKVNGVSIFCKGGNWGMDDGMKRVSRERLEPYFKLHHDANFNMIRNWTGESTEEVFYNLCDEYGMLVWNDFWLSTEGYNLNVNDNRLFMANATEVVKRFRNHASIAIWCPRNEGYAPVLIEPLLADLIASEDGTRYYQPNSRNLNLRPSGPWHYMTDPAEYYRKNAEGFSTELGTPSVPTAATIRSFMPAQDQWPISDTWFYHDLHDGQKDYIQAIETKYGKSTNLDDFCKKAQLINYDSHRAMFESWNSKMWKKASGLLLWMSHPAWPSMVWQTYSWDYETFGSFFGSKKACEPIHIQINLHDNKVVLVNTSLANYGKLSAKLELFDLKGEKLFSKSITVKAPSNQLTDCFVAVLPSGLPAVYLLRLSLSDGSKVLSMNEYWKSNREDGCFEEFNQLKAASLSAKIVKQKEGKVTFVVSNQSKVPAIGVKLNLRNPQSGKIILPANFSEGYFTLLPGEKKHIVADWNSTFTKNTEVIGEAYNFKSQFLVLIKQTVQP